VQQNTALQHELAAGEEGQVEKGVKDDDDDDDDDDEEEEMLSTEELSTLSQDERDGIIKTRTRRLRRRLKRLAAERKSVKGQFDSAMEKLKYMFDCIDTDSSGFLSRKELQRGVEKDAEIAAFVGLEQRMYHISADAHPEDAAALLAVFNRMDLNGALPSLFLLSSSLCSP
jgi:hypothetical protein